MKRMLYSLLVTLCGLGFFGYSFSLYGDAQDNLSVSLTIGSGTTSLTVSFIDSSSKEPTENQIVNQDDINYALSLAANSSADNFTVSVSGVNGSYVTSSGDFQFAQQTGGSDNIPMTLFSNLTSTGGEGTTPFINGQNILVVTNNTGFATTHSRSITCTASGINASTSAPGKYDCQIKFTLTTN